MPLRLLATLFARVPLREGALPRLRGDYSDSPRHNNEVVRHEQQDSHRARVAFGHPAAEYIARSSAEPKEVAFRQQTSSADHRAASPTREKAK